MKILVYQVTGITKTVKVHKIDGDFYIRTYKADGTMHGEVEIVDTLALAQDIADSIVAKQK
jgi:hypothetical protein